MPINVFLSRATPHEKGQKDFLHALEGHLAARGLLHRTIGHTDHGTHPMHQIRSVMMDCNGLLGVAFRRFRVIEGEDRPQRGQTARSGKEQGLHSHGSVRDAWLTTPYLHLEAAIAFSIGLPVLLIVERGVILEGAVEPGVMTQYPPLFDTTSERTRREFIESPKWNQLVNTWEAEVREVVFTKGQPRRPYNR